MKQVSLPKSVIGTFLLIVLGVAAGCSSSKLDTERATRARHVARAAQAMAESANLGLLGLPISTYQERDPNPNPYVGNLLFDRYCDSCHGSSHKAPAITRNRTNSSDAKSDYYIIQYGIVDMPGFRTKLTKFQIYDIMCYMGDDLTPIIGEQQNKTVSSDQN